MNPNDYQDHNTEASALFTDKYTLTMSQMYWKEGAEDWMSFELFVRSLKHRNYLVAAGLQSVLDYIRTWHFTPENIAYLPKIGNFDEGFLQYLSTIRFTGNIYAVREGTVTAGGTPLLRIEAPVVQGTLLESALLSITGQQTMIASKAARIVQTAAGRPVWDFSLRRDHGLHASLGVARASYIAGCAGTATVEAGARWGMPVAGTMAHQSVMRHGEDREQDTFETFLRVYPQEAVLLVDTYDTVRGVQRAIAASRATDTPLKAIRIDSGDLAALTILARQMLDEAGMPNTGILLSNDLDEYKIADLLAAGAPVDTFGVGTMLGVSADAPSVGIVYKAGESLMPAPDRPQYIMKLSPGKETDPGRHQVWRQNGVDTLSLWDETLPGEPLIQQVMQNGQQIMPQYSLEDIQAYALAQQTLLSDAERQLVGGSERVLQRSQQLWQLRASLGDTQAPQQLERISS